MRLGGGGRASLGPTVKDEAGRKGPAGGGLTAWDIVTWSANGAKALAAFLKATHALGVLGQETHLGADECELTAKEVAGMGWACALAPAASTYKEGNSGGVGVLRKRCAGVLEAVTVAPLEGPWWPRLLSRAVLGSTWLASISSWVGRLGLATRGC